jgi:hypothetical protein
MNYLEFIKNRTVAIVGPAQYMMGKKLGEEIDNHDIVVRINRSIESCNNFSSDIGERTDVLYSCMIEKPENAGKINIEDWVKKNISFICVPPKSTMSGVASSSSQISDSANYKKFIATKNKINTRIIDAQLNNKIANEVKCRPNTGYLSIFDILAHTPSKLSLYGFSFYLDGFIKNSKDGISGMSEDDFANKCFNSKRHIQSNLWRYAKESLLVNRKVHLDETLDKILRMKSFSKIEFKNNIINI